MKEKDMYLRVGFTKIIYKLVEMHLIDVWKYLLYLAL